MEYAQIDDQIFCTMFVKMKFRFFLFDILLFLLFQIRVFFSLSHTKFSYIYVLSAEFNTKTNGKFTKKKTETNHKILGWKQLSVDLKCLKFCTLMRKNDTGKSKLKNFNDYKKLQIRTMCLKENAHKNDLLDDTEQNFFF